MQIHLKGLYFNFNLKFSRMEKNAQVHCDHM